MGYDAPSFVVPVYPEPEDGIVVGTNRLSQVPFPVVAGSHYFHAYSYDGRVVWDVFSWHPDLKCPRSYEVRASLPVIDGAWEAGGGTVVYRPTDDDFELSIAPSRMNSADIVLEVGGGEIWLNEDGIRSDSVTAIGNAISGCFAAFVFGADGSVAIGQNSPPDGMLLAMVQPA